MKNTIRITAVLLLVLLLTLALASCTKTLSGSYKAQIGSAESFGTELLYTFSGSKVTVKATAGIAGFGTSYEFEGKYEIFTENDVEYIKFTFDDADAASFNAKVTFEETDDGIKLEGIEFKKQ